MREIDVRVTGFNYTTHHSYTTEVEVDGRTWTLGIRYNTFYQFYTRLTALEKHFNVDFPPKGGLFFSPPPEERQEQLDDFLLSTLAYFDMRGHPRRMEALLGELLRIPEHLGIKDDEERTASEGSSVAEELMLDGLSTPMPGHDDEHTDFLESGHEGDDHDGLEDHSVLEKVEVDSQVEEVLDHDHDNHQENQANDETHEEAVVALVELEEKPEAVEAEVVEVKPEEKQEVVEDESSPKSESKVQPLPGQDLTGGSVAKDYIAMLRRRTLVNGAIEAAVVSAMKNVVKAKTEPVVKVEATSEEQKPVEENKELNAVEAEEIIEQKAPIPEQGEQAAVPPVPVLEVPEVVTTAPKDEAVGPLEPVVASTDNEDKHEEVPVTSDTETAEQYAVAETAVTPQKTVQVDESSSGEEEEVTSDPSKKEAESENVVVGWFRRMGTFSPSAAEKEEQEAAAAKEKEAQEVTARAEAEAREQTEKEAAARAEAEAEAAETELLRAEQELNLRLKLYRHPVFFQGFNCDVGTSRYSLPQRQSDGIVV